MTGLWKRLSSAVAIALAVPVYAQAQQAPAAPGYTMPSTQMWDITSDSGEVYRIFVSYPSAEAPAKSWPAAKMPAGGWPVLYVLDGNAMFAGFAEARRLQEMSDVGKSIVVGIGYPTDLAYSTRRLYDYTGGPPPPPWDAALGKERNGGWDKFLDFLTGKLRTEIDRRYTINRNRQALFGHSLGGLFAVHALFSRPDAFHAVIAASPSLFWHEREMLKAERDFVARLQAGAIPKVGRLMVVAGGKEETPLEKWDGEALARRLEPLSAYGLRTRSEIYVDEGHMTVPSRAVTETLRFAFSWP